MSEILLPAVLPSGLVHVLESDPVDPTSVGDYKENAIALAREFRERTAEIVRLIGAIQLNSKALNDAFDIGDSGWRDFEIDFHFHGERHAASTAEALVEKMKRTAWRTLVRKLGIVNIMSVKRRKEFEEQLEKGTLPAIDEDTIIDVIRGLAGQAQQFALEAAKEVFEILRPIRSEYKTNDRFRVGRRVILSGAVERYFEKGKFHVSHWKESHLIAIDGVFHLLDGKGVMRDHRGPLVQAICNAENGKGETNYFFFKCFKNRNLHLEFRRLDLVQELNMLAVGERVLGEDVE